MLVIPPCTTCFQTKDILPNTVNISRHCSDFKILLFTLPDDGKRCRFWPYSQTLVYLQILSMLKVHTVYDTGYTQLLLIVTGTIHTYKFCSYLQVLIIFNRYSSCFQILIIFTGIINFCNYLHTIKVCALSLYTKTVTA